MNTLRRRPLFAWIAVLAIALAALMPTVSRALMASAAGGGAPAGWFEICSSAGVRWVSMQTGQVSSHRPDTPDTPQAPVLDACPYCVLATERQGPPASPPLFLPLPGRAVAPEAAHGYQATPPAVASERARGPPSFSPDSFSA